MTRKCLPYTLGIMLALVVSAQSPTQAQDWARLRAKLRPISPSLVAAFGTQPLSEGKQPLLEELNANWTVTRTKGEVVLDFGTGQRPFPAGEVLEVDVPYPRAKPLERRLIRLDGPQSEPAWAFADVLEVKVGPRYVVLVDRNANGFFDDPKVDGVFFGKAKDLAPNLALADFSGLIEVKGRYFFLAVRQDDAQAFALSEKPAPDLVRFFSRLNQLRARHGLPPTGLAEDLVEACLDHAKYASVHGLVYEQESRYPEFTPAGAKIAEHAVYLQGDADKADACLEEGLTSMLDRAPLLWGRLPKIGVGVHKSLCVVEVKRYGGQDGMEPPTFYPAPGETGVGCRALVSRAREDVPNGIFNTPGLPIGIYFGRNLGPVVEKATVTVVPSGEVVPTRTSSPADVPPGIKDNYPTNGDAIGVWPDGPLKANTRHRVEVVYRVGNGRPRTLSWTFTTGALE